MNQTSRRIQRVYQRIQNEIPDAIFIKNSVEPHIDLSFFYFTNLESGIFENSIFLAYPNGEASLYTSKLEEESAKEGSTRFKTTIFKDSKEKEMILKKIGTNIDKIGVNSRELTYQDLLILKKTLPNVKILDVSKAITEARLVKDDEEIKKLRTAAEITTKVWKNIPSILSNNVTESEVKAQISYQIQKEGATTAFEPITSFGINTAEPHYLGGNAELKSGDFALFDFGARNCRYCADLTRTLVVGRPSYKQRQIYDAVFEASDVALDMLKPGIEASEVHRKVVNTIASKGFRKEFTHSTGHALGLAVHDGATLSNTSKFTLEEGMVFTIEPGIYLPGFGGVRIEDDVLIRKGDCEILTSTGREMLEI